MFEHTRPVSERLVAEIDPRPGHKVLDLAAGTGETGFLVAERIGPTGRLYATDVAVAMVDAARRGAAARGLDNVECSVVDAQEIDLPDDSVDAVVSRFGLMLMPRPERAVAEIRRVLRPGGRCAYAVWGPLDRNPWLGLIVGALLRHGHTPGDPFAAGGPFSLASPEVNRELLEGAGFTEIAVSEVSGAMPFERIDDYWSLQTAVGGPLPALVKSMHPAEVGLVRATLEPAMEEFRTRHGYALPLLALVVSAT
jgi:SAM-dependent methyltransferase